MSSQIPYHDHFEFNQSSGPSHFAFLCTRLQCAQEHQAWTYEDDLSVSSEVVYHDQDVSLSSKRLISSWTHEIQM